MTKIKRLQSIFTRLLWYSLWDKTKLSVIGSVSVLLTWRYTLVTIVAILLFGMIFGVLAIGTSEWNLLMSSLPIVDKLEILVRAVIRLFTQVNSPSQLLIVLVVLLQGITIALLVFNLRQQHKSRQMRSSMSNRVGESTTASLIATLGLGCSACGTSLIIPLISVVSSSAVFLGAVTTAIVVIALLLLTYSSWNMGHTAYMFTNIAKSHKKGI